MSVIVREPSKQDLGVWDLGVQDRLPDLGERRAPEPAQQVRPQRRPRQRELRPGWGTGRRTRPTSRPAHPVSAPRLEPAVRPDVASCRVSAPVLTTQSAPAPVPSRWRLTERGIALVLATGLAIAAAALVVVSLTALQVTGDSYAPAGQLTALQH